MNTRSSVVALACGAATGALAERALVRRRVRSHEPGGALPTLDDTRREAVTAADGVELAGYEAGPPAAELTLVFVHGYTVSASCWAAQVRDLADTGVRMVLYDQRGHGASGVGATKNDTIEQLGRDLSEVLRQGVRSGPVLLAGHSMGGMTIMALAEQQPDLFGDRVAGVALIDTSSAGMGQVSLGLPAALAAPMTRLVPHAPRASAIQRRAERSRASDSDFARLLNARISFGPDARPPAYAAMARMQAPMKLETMAAFLPTFSKHDRTAFLSALKAVPTLIMVGEQDVLTPPSHSQVIADALPHARFVTVPGSGHMLMMEQPDAVTEQLRSLIGQVR